MCSFNCGDETETNLNQPRPRQHQRDRMETRPHHHQNPGWAVESIWQVYMVIRQYQAYGIGMRNLYIRAIQGKQKKTPPPPTTTTTPTRRMYTRVDIEHLEIPLLIFASCSAKNKTHQTRQLHKGGCGHAPGVASMVWASLTCENCVVFLGSRICCFIFLCHEMSWSWKKFELTHWLKFTWNKIK